MEVQQTMQKIVSSSGKSEEEVKKLVGAKKEKFAGLLTESGAALMVAKELGVELGLEEKRLERLQVSQLKGGMNNVEVLARAKHIFSPKNFEKNGKKGILCSLIVGDSTGEIRLTVWGKEVARLQEQAVEKGTVLLLKNCYVNSYKEIPQLNLSYNGNLLVNPEIDVSDLPPAEEKCVALEALMENESDASVLGRIIRVFPEKSFEKDGRQGRLINFLIGDGTAIVRATAWNEAVDRVKKLSSGEAVKIEGCYTKSGLRGAELQLGFRARILKNPTGGEKLPGIAKMQGIEMQEKKVSGLVEGDLFVAINAEIANVLPGQLRFNVCPECGKKVEATEGRYLCEECGEVQPDIRAVVSLKLKDETGEINSVLFGETAEKAIGMNKEELKKRLEVNTAEQLIAELRDAIAGKNVKVNGFVKMNGFSNQLEFSAKEFSFLE
ncbi:MAG: OB-fold nucleic acid binding domain-containing protein [archaeon]|jgi:replication factor A1|nr:OB-fold nucleic acid binding domain-containing protein [archaeon]